MAETVRVGVQDRLRPVLMTACITALGMIPLLLASGPGRRFNAAGDRSVGALLSSTALTLLLLPLLFERFGMPRARRPTGREICNEVEHVSLRIGRSRRDAALRHRRASAEHAGYLPAESSVREAVAQSPEVMTAEARRDATLARPKAFERDGPRLW
ncbi:hypothetical protein GCM10023063_49950 [Arthrobacter methylotrophus]